MASGAFSGDDTLPSESSEGGSANIALHVLSPSLPPPSRFTLDDLPRSTTIAGLKDRISQSLPSQPSSQNQRLIYRGRPLVNQHETLRSILEPPGESEYTIHLVLPPAPAAPSLDHPAPTATRDSFGINEMQRNRFFTPGQLVVPNVPQAQGLRYRGPGEIAADQEFALRQRLDAIRRLRGLSEMQERGSRSPSQETGNTTSSLPSHSPSPSQQPLSQRIPEAFSSPPTPTQQQPSIITATTTSVQSVMPSTTSTARSSFAGSDISDFTDSQQLRLQILRHQIALGEDQLSRGIVPPFDHIVRMRTQLFQILDDQYRNPLARRDGTVESLLTRVTNMYTRADQLRIMQARSTIINPQNNLAVATVNDDSSEAPVYILASPEGREGLITSPGGTGTGVIQASLVSSVPVVDRTTAARAAQNMRNMPGPAPNPALANPNAAVMENVVRQAALNHQLNNNDHQLGLARTIRRIWLFVRLYFFCYMFSEPGTWERIIFVCMAVIISLMSDTGVPQRLHRTLIAPVQRHVEGIVEQPRYQQPVAARQSPTGAATQPRDHREPQPPQPTGLWHNIRRTERSVLFFMASLFPGVIERYVAVTNEMETRNAQRAREEEEQNRHREEEANRTNNDAEQFQDAQDTNDPHAHPTTIPRDEGRH